LFAATNTWSPAVEGFSFRSNEGLYINTWGSGSNGLFKNVWYPEAIEMRHVEGMPFTIHSFRVSYGWGGPLTGTLKGFDASGTELFSETVPALPTNNEVVTVTNSTVQVARVEFHWMTGDSGWPNIDDIVLNDTGGGGGMIATQPASATKTAGEPASFSVVLAEGHEGATFQWTRNSQNIPGATGSTLAIPSAQAFHAGDYTCVVTHAEMVETSDVATLTVNAAPPSAAQVANTSNRGEVGTGASVLIAGFWVSNEGSKTFLIRAVGPAIAAPPFNVPGTLADPVLHIYDASNNLLFTCDNWGENGDAAAITAAQTATGAGLTLASGSADAALVVTLPPGGYTAQAVGKDGATGIALVEVYLVP